MKESKDEQDIKINKRSTDKVFFESTLLQQISDGIDFIRDESREILREIDLRGLDEVDIEEIGQKVTCDVNTGLICRGSEQIGVFRSCFNYTIRVLCEE